MSNSAPEITEPVAIFKVAHRYIVYDVDTVTYLRREHNVSGVLIGSLPQASQQNVFLGLPLELMPEEARLLVEMDIAYVVDDVAEHKRNFLGKGLGAEERKAFQAALRKQGQGAAAEASKKSDERKMAALKKMGVKATENWNDIPEDMLKLAASRQKGSEEKDESATSTTVVDEDGSLFATPDNPSPEQNHAPRFGAASDAGFTALEPYSVTPTTSYPPLQAQKQPREKLPPVPPSYPLYRHLHAKNYFMAPGLRFGCQYMAYPGDPLRFHSHFLCNGMDWDQEFDLLDLVGGGRLGTGVKKGFLVGGEQKKEGSSPSAVRAFCIEWGGM